MLVRPGCGDCVVGYLGHADSVCIYGRLLIALLITLTSARRLSRRTMKVEKCITLPSLALYLRWMRRYREDPVTIWGNFPAFRSACATRNRHLVSEEADIAAVRDRTA
jgi:hypothetical protein